MNVDLSAACVIIGFLSLAFFGWCMLEAKRVTKPDESEKREGRPPYHGGYVSGGGGLVGGGGGFGSLVTVQGSGSLAHRAGGGGGPGSGKTVNINIKAPTERVVKRPPVHDPIMAKAVVETLARAGMDLSGYEDWIAGGAMGEPAPAPRPTWDVPHVGKGGAKFLIDGMWSKQQATFFDFYKGSSTDGEIEVAGLGHAFYQDIDRATSMIFGAPHFNVWIDIHQIELIETQLDRVTTVKFRFMGGLKQHLKRQA